jgi:hypothetical protein
VMDKWPSFEIWDWCHFANRRGEEES